MNIRKSKPFIALSLASDLQNIADGVFYDKKSQIETFVRHAQGLLKDLHEYPQISHVLSSITEPVSDEARLKLADKVMTFSSLLQSTYARH